MGYTFVTATELVSSGVPQPTGGSYLSAAQPSDETTAELGYIDACGYDAASELEGILERDDIPLAAADRSRIVGALADIDAVSRD